MDWDFGSGIADGLKKAGITREEIWATLKLPNDRSVIQHICGRSDQMPVNGNEVARELRLRLETGYCHV